MKNDKMASITPYMAIFIKAENQSMIPLAQEISLRFPGAKITEELAPLNNSIIIYVSKQGISLGKSGNAEKPVFIDFTSGQMQYRQKNSGTRKEALARAVGMKSGNPISIIDATAGLGGDSFILASLGADMLMLERNPLVFLLLEDAIKRAKLDMNLQNIMQRMQLMNADTITFLENIESQPDVIYMDPMFPDKTKTSLSKKEMRLFREIAGPDEDIGMLLTKALSAAKKRVVIKRPARSAYVNEQKPHFELVGKSSRFDVYMVGI